MVDVSPGSAQPPTLGVLFQSTRPPFSSSPMARTGEWYLSNEIPADITVRIGGSSFSLHKTPLRSKCGYIRRLVASDPIAASVIDISDFPGGPEAFELAVKFCYGVDFEINTGNVAALRCAAELLEMTEERATGNLISRTEDYLREVALANLPSAVTVLHHCEGFMSWAENAKLVSRCVDAVAFLACSDSNFSGSSRRSDEEGGDPGMQQLQQSKGFVDWWAEDLTVLRVDLFQSVLTALKGRGFKQDGLGTVLMLYAQKSLRGLDIFGRGRKKLDPQREHEKRVVLETIVGILPRQKNAMSVSFLTMLLRAAVYLETTVACRLDLERRIGSQLGQATLDDLLIPSFSFAGDTVFDVDSVQRILVNYLEEQEGRMVGYRNTDDEPGWAFSSPDDMERVGRLMESYLAEVASDSNLTVNKFVGLAELIPEQSRTTEDGMYRAIDIYLKAHKSINDVERKKICSVMDCQRLSREACAHAAQNDRLPVQIVVQVLYYEQQRMRDLMVGSAFVGGAVGSGSPIPQGRRSGHSSPRAPPSADEMVRLRRENDDLKMELVRVKMMMRENGKSGGGGQQLLGLGAGQQRIGSDAGSQRSTGTFSGKPGTGADAGSQRSTGTFAGKPGTGMEKPPLPKKTLIQKLGRLNPFMWTDITKSPKGRTKPPKDRRHSIS